MGLLASTTTTTTTGRLPRAAARPLSMVSVRGSKGSATSSSSSSSSRTEQDLIQVVNDEKRGIFRQLDIGLPRNVGMITPGSGRPSARRTVVKAPPRSVETPSIQSKIAKSVEKFFRKLQFKFPDNREKLMKPDQDWNRVWPAQRTFHPAVVPLPVRQGFVQLKAQVTPSKYANVELLKVPNFLHLTPPAIRAQCQRLKAFCTPWPPGTPAAGRFDACSEFQGTS